MSKIECENISRTTLLTMILLCGIIRQTLIFRLGVAKALKDLLLKIFTSIAEKCFDKKPPQA